jgi:hypothetical protein
MSTAPVEMNFAAGGRAITRALRAHIATQKVPDDITPVVLKHR